MSSKATAEFIIHSYQNMVGAGMGTADAAELVDEIYEREIASDAKHETDEEAAAWILAELGIDVSTREG